MIAQYLNLLYSNCKSLAKTGNYDFIAVESHFTSEISDVVGKYGFGNETDLIAHLINTPYRDLLPVLKASDFIHVFYLVNSMSEYAYRDKNLDELGRLQFSGSVQSQNGVVENLVWNLIKSTVRAGSFLSAHFEESPRKSYFFLSHDIDSLYGSTLQDGLWAFKNKRFDVLFKLFVNILSAKPHWFNIDLIMDLESEYDFKSTFYWLVNKGKIDARQTNSDYDIASDRLVQTMKEVADRGFENGLHKSISDDTFKTELSRLPIKTGGNRYHYLKYKLPDGYLEIEDAGLKLDASLGFAEHYGFRNNYGYPFSPYDFKTGKPHSFIEVPLNIMDGTFQRYMKVPVNKTADTVIGFLNKHKYDCLLSVLWHNTFFTDYKYKGYRQEYIKILQFLYEEKFTNINQSGIIELFAWKK